MQDLKLSKLTKSSNTEKQNNTDEVLKKKPLESK